MDYKLSQHWIDTFSDNDWNNASLSQYWHQLYNLEDEETLWDNNAFNSQVLTKYKITQSDLTRSLMYLTNTMPTSNPRPAVWALQQMKRAFPKVFATEFATCFQMAATHHPSMFPSFAKMGGGAQEFEEILKKLKTHNLMHLLPDALEHFVVHEDDYSIYKNLESVKKELYQSIGLENGQLSGELKIDWLFTHHIQKAMVDVDRFERIWTKIVQMYPHPQAVDAITKYINSPHHSHTSDVSLLLSVLNKPMQEQNFELMRALTNDQTFFSQALAICVGREWSFTNNDVMKKFLSFAEDNTIEQAFTKVCQKENGLLNQANRLCEWVDPHLHAKITEIALLALCKKHPHIYNNLQKMTLISDLHTEPKPKSRKM